MAHPDPHVAQHPHAKLFRLLADRIVVGEFRVSGVIARPFPEQARRGEVAGANAVKLDERSRLVEMRRVFDGFITVN